MSASPKKMLQLEDRFAWKACTPYAWKKKPFKSNAWDKQKKLYKVVASAHYSLLEWLRQNTKCLPWWKGSVLYPSFPIIWYGVIFPSPSSLTTVTPETLQETWMSKDF